MFNSWLFVFKKKNVLQVLVIAMNNSGWFTTARQQDADGTP